VHRYVSGALEPQETEEFEQHLLQCAECREAVRVGAALRAELAGAIRRHARWRLAIPAGLVAAAATLAIAVRQDDPVRRLAVVSAPQFRGAPVRSAGEATPRLVDEGMRAYAANDFAAAARWLTRASSSDSSAAVLFYLGVSHLLNGDARRAIRALTRVRFPEGNPYAADAVYLEAKAWLRLGFPDSALAALAVTARGSGPPTDSVKAFADSIRVLTR